MKFCISYPSSGFPLFAIAGVLLVEKTFLVYILDIPIYFGCGSLRVMAELASPKKTAQNIPNSARKLRIAGKGGRLGPG
jgi:hypothetical protein